jgi:hypothetical protein
VDSASLNTSVHCQGDVDIENYCHNDSIGRVMETLQIRLSPMGWVFQPSYESTTPFVEFVSLAGLRHVLRGIDLPDRLGKSTYMCGAV